MKSTRAYDILGNIALVKFDRKASAIAKKKFARRIMSENKTIKTVLEKTGKFKGRLRKQETKYVAGEKTKEVLYHENGCAFRFNIDKTYFSPRLSNERKEIASMIKKESEVLVMFAGVGPYSIVIAKNSKAKRVDSNEINREANEYAELNIGLNKVKNKVIMLNGNIQNVATKVKRGLKINNEKVPSNFDYIVMPRPRLKDSFLKEAFSLSKKGTIVFYYDFCGDEEKKIITDKIQKEAATAKKKIKILRTKTAGEIAPHKIRIRVDFKVV
jgi:tRNA (guanine37-N1)-methyltransferase